MRLSAALIAKGNEPTLEQAIDSIRHHVDEIVLLVTGPSLSTRVGYVDRIAHSDACNAMQDCAGPCQCKAGDILDFAAARNASFELATGDKIVWLDSDDIVVGAKKLRELAETDAQVLSPYAYRFQGETCTEEFWLPRIVSRDKRWSAPIHEELTGLESGIKRSEAIWCHLRSEKEGHASSERNLRIFAHHEKSPTWDQDARFWYLYGSDLASAQRRIHAAEVLIRAFKLTRPNTDLACIVAQSLARCLWQQPMTMPLEWAHRALNIRPDWPSCFFLLADAYEAADRPMVARQFAKMGCELPREDTIWPIDPSARGKWKARLPL